MNIQERIEAFVFLGEKLNQVIKGNQNESWSASQRRLFDYVSFPEQFNPWFTSEFVVMALNAIVANLTFDKLASWSGNYVSLSSTPVQSKVVGVVMAGNIPAVGFHDFLCVLVSGHSFLGKLSSKDDIILREIAAMLIEIEPRFENKIGFTDNRLGIFDAIIATGNNNTSRYFEYYFGKYPHIIRKNRNGVAVLTGSESAQDIIGLELDILSYFGLGCRNVSRVYLPEGMDAGGLLNRFGIYSHLAHNHKYRNNYDYFKSVYMINGDPYYDNGYLLAKNLPAISTPVSVLGYSYYKEINEVIGEINDNINQIQCVAGNNRVFKESVGFGQTQFPSLSDYADKTDTLRFLIDL